MRGLTLIYYLLLLWWLRRGASGVAAHPRAFGVGCIVTRVAQLVHRRPGDLRLGL